MHYSWSIQICQDPLAVAVAVAVADEKPPFTTVWKDNNFSQNQT